MAVTTRKGKSNGSVSSADAPTQAMSVEERDADLVCPRCGHGIVDSPYCAQCGLHVAVEPDVPTRAAWRASQKEAPTEAASPPKADRPKRSAISVVLPLVGLLAVIALGIAVATMITKPNTAPLQSQIAQLRSQLASAKGQLSSQNSEISIAQKDIANLQNNSQAGAVSNLKSQIGGVSNQVSKLLLCLPELQQEVFGLNINTTSTGGYLNSAYLNNPTIISTNCTKTLNGS